MLPRHQHVRPVLLSQVQMLPKDPLHPQSKAVLGSIAKLVRGLSDIELDRAAMMHMQEHYAALGLVPALMQRAALLCTVPLLSTPAGLGALQAVPAATAPGRFIMLPMSAVDVEGLSAILQPIADILVGMLPVRTVALQPGGDDGDPTCLILDQLVSNTGFVAAMLQRGLSADVTAAAAAGGSAPLACAVAVRRLFWRVAYLLRQQAGEGGDDRRQLAAGIRRKLASVLSLECNLPYLEPLCLPLSDSGASV
jgi:hypothetical protein